MALAKASFVCLAVEAPINPATLLRGGRNDGETLPIPIGSMGFRRVFRYLRTDTHQRGGHLRRVVWERGERGKGGHTLYRILIPISDRDTCEMRWNRDREGGG